jgi:hypothetical protein
MRSIFKWLQKVGATDFEPLENTVLLASLAYVNPAVITSPMDDNAATSKIDNYGFGNKDFDSSALGQNIHAAQLYLSKPPSRSRQRTAPCGPSVRGAETGKSKRLSWPWWFLSW